ncbi:MAG: PAS domain S-box protein [Candidatus Limnocylindrales bacterium]
MTDSQRTTSAERLLAVAEAMVDPLLVLQAVRAADGRIEDFAVTYANPAYVRLYGVERWRAAGRRLSNLVPDLRGANLFDIYQRVTETGEPHVIDEFPLEGVDADGSPKRYAIDLRIVRVDDGVAVTGREISGYLATRDALVASEERFRLLAERSQDVIFRYRTAPVAAFDYVSPSIEALAGYTAQDLYVDAQLAFAMIHEEDRPDFEARLKDGRLFREPFLARWVGKDGRVVWIEQTNTAILDETGRRVAVEGVARDATQRVQAAANVATSEARFRMALDGIGLHAMILDVDGRIVFTNQFVSSRSGWTRDDLLGRDAIDTFIPAEQRAITREQYREALRTENAAEPWESTWLGRDGTPIRIAWTSSFIRDASGAITGLASVGEDVTERRRLEDRHDRLAAAVDQTAESIFVTDVQGRIVYANPAFEASAGVRAADAIGQRPWALLPLEPGGPRFRQIASELRAGRTWTGEWELVRPDGRRRREEASISAVRTESGAVSGYVVVARDVTDIREIQSTLDATMTQRAAVAHALGRMEARPTVEATAREITDAIVELPGVDVALLVAFDGDEGSTVIAVNGEQPHPIKPGAALPPTRAAYLRERAAAGPWVEPWERRPEDGEYGAALTEAGVQAVAYAPLLSGRDLIGLLAMGTVSPASALRFEDQLPIVVELAVNARSLLAGPLHERRDARRGRTEIEAVLATGTFRSVYQPVVEMSNGAAIGYEALTRFDDGTPPDRRFAAARRCGLGLELEAATLERAVADSLLLPAGPWLALNVTAEMVLDGDRLAAILRRRTRPVVLEITEHDAIEDYQAVRGAVAALGPDVRIAVDDAGAGVANFTHIVQLRPDWVKIDASLVRGVNSDLTRQALIVGLHHFARATNGWVIAEGVETEEERLALVSLGLSFAQGYHFGRPAPAEAWERPQPVMTDDLGHDIGGWLRR